MGRAFEYRKARKLKRWGNMARTFSKLGKEIAIAVKAAGPDPAGNTRLRVLIQNAKAANMPKENVERAIKRATSKEMGDYKEMVYEGYAPFWHRDGDRDGNRQYDPARWPTCGAISTRPGARSARRDRWIFCSIISAFSR